MILRLVLQNETAFDFQKGYSITRSFDVEFFQSSNERIFLKLAKIIFRKSFGF